MEVHMTFSARQGPPDSFPHTTTFLLTAMYTYGGYAIASRKDFSPLPYFFSFSFWASLSTHTM